MYYILNQLDQVVAVAPRLLDELGIPDINTFYQKVALKEADFSLEGDKAVLTVDGVAHTVPAQVEDLEGMLGNVRVVDIAAQSLQEAAKVPSNDEILDDITEDDLLRKIEEEPEEPSKTDTEMLSFEEDDLFEIKEPEPENEPSPAQSEENVPLTEDEELYELTIPTDADNAISTIEEEKVSSETASQAAETESEGPIYIDVARISEKIGISPEDYNLFLDEYIDTALGYEQALVSNNESEKEEALSALSHLSNVLQLPTIGELLTKIKESADADQEGAISAFFTALGRLSTAKFEESREAPATEEEPEEASAPQTPEERGEKAKAAIQGTEESKYPPIDLSDIKPIHFDFQLEEAAKDLSLPVELIEEFVNDFIAQAHEETEKMLKAYERGDLESVQKIGHLLKGTASNLRINPLSDTLYEIQFNEDIGRVPELVKNYWAHFLSLENQIKLISNK